MPAIVIPAPISSNHAAPVSAGGTGATTAAAARTNLDVYSKSEVTNAISQSTADTGLKTLVTGVTYRRIGYMVQVYFSNQAYSSSQTIGTLPVGYRPAVSIRQINQDGKLHVRVADSGAVSVELNSGSTSAYAVGVSVVYPTTDAMP